MPRWPLHTVSMDILDAMPAYAKVPTHSDVWKVSSGSYCMRPADRNQAGVQQEMGLRIGARKTLRLAVASDSSLKAAIL